MQGISPKVSNLGLNSFNTVLVSSALRYVPVYYQGLSAQSKHKILRKLDINFKTEEAHIIEPQATDAQTQKDAAATDYPNSAMFAQHAPAENGLINLNTASFEQLRTLPHIGCDRALDIMTLRSITLLSQLRAIKGIGPARLVDIKRAGVTL